MADLEKRERLIALARGWTGPSGVVETASAKKAVSVEKLLQWAYRDELPKVARLRDGGPLGFPKGLGKTAREIQELGIDIDDNRYGVVPDFSAQTFPHDDAVRVHEAVMRLDELELTIPDDWNPIEDMGDWDGHAAAAVAKALDDITRIDKDGLRRLRRTPRALVFRATIMGHPPEWSIDAPMPTPVTDYGKVKWFRREVMWFDGVDGLVQHEIEVDGMDRKLRIPMPDAYNKFVLDPDPHMGLVGRAEYEVWHAALSVLVADLDDGLESHEALPTQRLARPWEEAGGCDDRRILRDLRRPMRGAKNKKAPFS